jgi:hypothetical protein
MNFAQEKAREHLAGFFFELAGLRSLQSRCSSALVSSALGEGCLQEILLGLNRVFIVRTESLSLIWAIDFAIKN